MPESSPAPDLNSRVGARLRELRLERGLTQSDFARRLAISPAYLSLIEKGRRTVQLPLLWKALELLDEEPEPFMRRLGDEPVEHSLAQLLDEPLLRSLDLDRDALSALSAEPQAASTIAALFNLYKNARGQLDTLLQHLSREEAGRKARAGAPEELGDATLRFDYSPLDEVADFVQSRQNYFAVLEDAALSVRVDNGLGSRVTSVELERALAALGVRIEPLAVARTGSVIRRYDPAAGVLGLADTLSEGRRKFDLAHIVGLRLLEERGLLSDILGQYRGRHVEAPRLIKVHLANYFAGALLMPYESFFRDAQTSRYDVERLSRVYEMSYEAAAHRLTNLSDPKRRGVPMHFLRVDVAGNISKRYAATGLVVPSALGSCPKWVVHTTFLTPSQITKQFSVMPDSTAFFCFARISSHPVRGSLVKGTVYSIGLGTRAEDAHHLAYAEDQPAWDKDRAERIGVPVGVTCRFCERTDCNQRAAPSYKFAFNPDEYVKKDNFFSPLLESEGRRGRH
ncbi:MAG: DUF2083 domain-containing protein [Polyangiaceae bacterium]|nr:DUF2083 domain-containing protein [Polyangiaceae bacterium]